MDKEFCKTAIFTIAVIIVWISGKLRGKDEHRLSWTPTILGGMGLALAIIAWKM